MGRPNKTEPRCRQLNIGLTEREYEALCRRAEAVGMRPVYFGRALLLNGNSPIAVQAQPPVSTSQRLIFQALSRLGNNLNQLVRHLHQTGEPVPSDLEPLLRDIRQILARRL